MSWKRKSVFDGVAYKARTIITFEIKNLIKN